MKKFKSTKGHLLLEALLAVFFLSIVSVSLLPAVNFLMQRSKQSQLDTDASLLVQEGIEATYNVFLNINKFSEINSTNPGKSYELSLEPGADHDIWTLVNDTGPRGEQITGTPFTREIVISDVYRKGSDGEKTNHPNDSVDPGSKEVVVTVSWTDSLGRNQSVDAKLLVVNLTEGP